MTDRRSAPLGAWMILLAAAAASGITALDRSEACLVVQLVGGSWLHVVGPGESLASLGARHGVTPATLARQNGLEPDARLRPGRLLAVDNLHIAATRDGTAIVVNVPQRMLFVSRAGRAVAGYPIAVGRADWRTPLGDFSVVAKEERPTWDVPRSIQEEMRQRGQRVVTKMPPCPQNPLGDYWIALSLPAIGIHGTAAPLSIHRAVTHGCIRLHPDDIRAVFPHVDVGDRGSVVYEPVLVANVDGRIYLEAHPDVYRLQRGGARVALRRAGDEGGWSGCVNWSLAKEVLARRDGIARLVGVCVAAPR